MLTALLFALTMFLANWDPTATNVGLILDWPRQLTEKLFGQAKDIGSSFPAGDAFKTAFQSLIHIVLNFLFLYLVAVLMLREGRGEVDEEGG